VRARVLGAAAGGVIRWGGLRGFLEWRSARIAGLLRQSGLIGNPVVLAAESAVLTLLAAAICVPVAVLLAARVSPVFALVGLAPVAAYLGPEVRLREKVSARKEGVERELPFFSILVNVLGSAGVSLHSIFDSLADSSMFDAMKSEALLVKRGVEIFGEDPIDSFERISATHPSRKFGDFLLGYSSKVRSGGDIPIFFAGESGALLRELEAGWTMYASRVGVVGSMMVTMFGVVPLLLLIVGFFSPAASTVALLVFALLAVPVLASLLVVLAARMQPATDRQPGGRWKPALAVAGLGLASAEFLGLWLGAALSLLVFFAAYGVSARGARKEMSQVDEALPRFMKDLMEFKRQEYDLTKSLVTIGTRSKYSPAFDRFLGKAVSELRSGTPLDEVKADPGTRLSRLVFFVLGQMAYSGGGTVDTMFQLSQYAGKVVEMKKSVQAEMKPYLILSYLTPVLLVFGVAFVGAILSTFTIPLRVPGSVQVFGQGAGAGTGGLLQAADLLIVSTAAALGIVGAKITDFTVRNTLGASTNVAIAVGATLLVPLLNLHALLHAA
jgi:archaeal flagellar protein FlaJ